MSRHVLLIATLYVLAGALATAVEAAMAAIPFLAAILTVIPFSVAARVTLIP